MLSNIKIAQTPEADDYPFEALKALSESTLTPEGEMMLEAFINGQISAKEFSTYVERVKLETPKP